VVAIMTQKRTLDLDKVIAAATELIENQGLPETTMPNLAKALGVRSQSLYHYVKNRAQLLSLVAASRIRLLYQALVDQLIGLSGQDALFKFADIVRDWLRHDQALAVLLYHLNEFPDDSAIVQEVMSILELGDKLHLRTEHIASQHALVGAVLGYVFLDRMSKDAETPEEADRNYHDMILRLVNPSTESQLPTSVSN
jgi:AcrR family transcriptional regulator